jgi:hypothetical protein
MRTRSQVRPVLDSGRGEDMSAPDGGFERHHCSNRL